MRGVNLIGKSFKNQNLSGVDFSYADIRGADFTDATLIGANFSYARAGTNPKWQSIWGLTYLFLIPISGFLATLPNAVIAISLNSEINIFSSIYNTFILIIFIFITVFIGLNKAICGILIVLLLCGLMTIFVGLCNYINIGLGNYINTIDSIFNFLVNTFVSGLFFSASMIVATLAIAVILVWSKSDRLNFNLAFIFSVTLAICLVGINLKDKIIIWILSESITLIIVFLGLYIARQAIQENPKYTLVKNAVTNVKCIKSTSFKDAKLTDANFTQANLKDTDLRTVHLTRTNWLYVENLNQAYLSNTYLENIQIRQLLIERKGNKEKFDSQNLAGLNLEQANLAESSFIETNLSYSNLRDADLSQAILVRTQLDNADLTGAILTGACIENWRISQSTNLDRTICKYIYLRHSDSDKNSSDRFPYRREFEKYEFSDFIYKLLNTLELNHDRDFNPQAVINVLHSLSAEYQKNLEIVGVEKQGNGVMLKLSVPESIKHQEFQKKYQSRYKTLNLMLSNPEKLLPSSNVIEAQVSRLAESVEQLNREKYYIFDEVENKGILTIGPLYSNGGAIR